MGETRYWTATMCVALLSALVAVAVGCGKGREDEVQQARAEADEWRSRYEELAAETADRLAELDELREKLEAAAEEGRSLAAELAKLQGVAEQLNERKREADELRRKLDDLTPASVAPEVPETPPLAGEAPLAVRKRLEGLARALFDRGDADIARSVGQAAIQLGSEDPAILYAVAYGEAAAGRDEEAADGYSRLVEVLSQADGAHSALLAKCENNHAVLLMRQGDPEGAESHLLNAVAADAGFAPAYFNLGSLYAGELNRPEDAIGAFRDHITHGGTRGVSARTMILKMQEQLEASGGEPQPEE